MKKVISLTMVLLIICALPVFASASDSGILGYNINWSYDSSTSTLSLTGRGAVRTLHDNEKRPWYRLDDYIKTIKIGDNITTLYSELLSNYPRLQTLSIGEGVSVLPMITGCDSLTSVTLPNTLTTLSAHAFYDCRSLRSITIPLNVTTISSSAFATSCFDNIYVVSENQYFADVDGVLYSKDMETLIRCPLSKLEGVSTLTVPDSVKHIAPYAYSSGLYTDPTDSIKKIVLPVSLETIGASAFYGYDGLTAVQFPETLTKIEKDAFGACINLTDIYYKGTKEQWSKIEIGDGNDGLINAAFHIGDMPAQPDIPPEIILTGNTLIAKLRAFFMKILAFFKTLI